MPIDPNDLPESLRYIIQLADEHGSEARVLHYSRWLRRHIAYAENLKKRQIVPLAELYIRIRDRGDTAAINDWHNQADRNMAPPEATFPVFGLLCLFQQLGDFNIPPFNDGKVRYVEPPPKLPDWSALPPELAWIAEPAESYGHYQFDNRIHEFVTQADPTELAELRRLSARCTEQAEAIYRWMEPLSLVEHREAALVYFMQMLLTHANEMKLLD